MGFNPQQQQAIQALGSNVVVSASAGAGKTTVLIARLMKRILEDHVRIDEICAMTFTEAAAAEMKTRLLAELHSKTQSDDSPFLREQISLVETAQISTIHSFCLTIIKNYGYILGIDPSRSETILDDASVRLTRNKALEETLNAWLIESPDLMRNLLDTFSSNPINFHAMTDAILQIASWLEGKKDPNQAMVEVLDVYTTSTLEDLPEAYRKTLAISHGNTFRSLRDLLGEFIRISDATFDANDTKQEKFFTQSEHLLKHLETLQTGIAQIEAGSMAYYDNYLSFLDIKMLPNGKAEAYTQKRASIEKLIKDAAAGYQSPIDVIASLHQQYPIVEALFAFTKDYMHRYDALKQDMNALDFGDFERLALQILSANDYEIAQLMQPRYQEIMVDEFQDTNEYQDEIIRLISNGHNIFRVGDIKQSIYRFRGAKPHIMQNLMQASDTHTLFLSFNYRSKKDIVDYNNIVFGKLMNIIHDGSYSTHDNVDVGLDSQSVDSYPVEFHIIETQGERYFDGLNERQLQAQYLCQQILHYHQMGYAFKDMVVLTRTHAPKLIFKEAFEAANIPYYLDDRSGFYNSEVIQDVLHLLQYALTPDPYYLVYSLKSVFFSYSANTLANLKLQGDILNTLALHDPQTSLFLNDIPKRWTQMDIVSIIQEIMTLNDVYNNQLSLQDKTNLDFLLEKAIQYQSNNTPTLLGFMNFLSQFNDEKSSEGSPIGDDADVITSYTIHQSKGLQFPIVFVWGFGALEVQDHRKTLLTDDKLGLSIQDVMLPERITGKSLLRSTMESFQYFEEIEEQLRLLYVALTRPQQRLILLDVVKEFNNEPLSFNLITSKVRPVSLLYAASPSNTILKRIEPDSIENLSYVGTNKNSSLAFTLRFETREEEVLMLHDTSKQSLDLTKYSEGGLRYGTAMHEALETLPNRLWTQEDLNTVESRYHASLLKYNQNPFTQALYKLPVHEHEMPFTALDEDGIIDYYAHDNTNLILVDYKTDNATPEELVNRYKDQVSYYGSILQKQYPSHHISAYIYSFKNDAYIPIIKP